jgi:hypothetical protein
MIMLGEEIDMAVSSPPLNVHENVSMMIGPARP